MGGGRAAFCGDYPEYRRPASKGGEPEGGELSFRRKKNGERLGELGEFLERCSLAWEPEQIFISGENVYLLPQGLAQGLPFRFLRTGLLLGQLKKGRFEPSQALAMALGMADVVADSVGAVRLDTLFIDEGFGALDDHAREQAIRVLYELSGEDRLIGIISHVQELKEQIENKLLVKKGKNGSHVRWSY